MTAPDVNAAVRARFEAWYVENAFDYGRNPLGSRECGLQWKAWQAAHADLSGDVRELRRLLAVRVAGAMLYTDDGELSDASAAPHIDFLRDSAAEIACKLHERAKLTQEKP